MFEDQIERIKDNIVIRVLYYMIRFNFKKVINEIKFKKYYRIIEESKIFDKDWYLKVYPDVAAIGIDPIRHYLLTGANEGRSPSAFFLTSAYLEINPDVAKSNINPLVHYVLYGKSEGRQVKSLSHTDSDRLTQAYLRKVELWKTVLVIAWDVGHNPLGRAYMLAEVLDRFVHNVVIIGFQFPKYGKEIWEPLRNSRIPVIPIACNDYSEFIKLSQTITERFKPDIVVSCKARLPSVQLGLMFKKLYGCSLVVDIDDHELTFVGINEEVTLKSLSKINNEISFNDKEPYGPLWTGLALHFSKYADLRIVSNRPLEAIIHRSVILPHVRDEVNFNPELYNKDKSRIKYGLSLDSKYVLFFGTPRLHKGLDKLAQAIGEIDNPRIKLIIIGTIQNRSFSTNLMALAKNKLQFLNNQPFESIPEIVCMADLICLPQDFKNPISKYQLPAKAIDAIALQIPLLITPTPPVMELINEKLAEEIIPEKLSETIKSMLANDAVIKPQRGVFIDKYSYAAAEKIMKINLLNIVNSEKRFKLRGRKDIEELLDYQKNLFGNKSSSNNTSNLGGVNFVVFWKQNDTTLYGRRSDMILKYLASRQDVSKVTVFDSPISIDDLLIKRDFRDNSSEHRFVYIKTYQKRLGILNSDKISHDVFIYSKKEYENIYSKEFNDSYCNYIEEVLHRENIQSKKSIFIFFPKNFSAKAIINYFKPQIVVADIVDDHRAWPGISSNYLKKLHKNYEDILENSHFVSCNCEEVSISMREFHKDIRIIENAFDRNIRINPPINNYFYDKVKISKKQGKKIIGYTGNLERKINIPLLKKVAEQFSDALLVLIGSTHSNPDITEMMVYPNVIMPGVILYDEIAAWIAAFDVAILPHLDSELTRNMNPLKAYVYIGQNIPVVSSNIKNLPDDTPNLHIANDDSHFIQLISQILKNSNESINNNEFVEKNNWEIRLKNYFDEIINSFMS